MLRDGITWCNVYRNTASWTVLPCSTHIIWTKITWPGHHYYPSVSTWHTIFPSKNIGITYTKQNPTPCITIVYMVVVSTEDTRFLLCLYPFTATLTTLRVLKVHNTHLPETYACIRTRTLTTAHVLRCSCTLPVKSRNVTALCILNCKCINHNHNTSCTM